MGVHDELIPASYINGTGEPMTPKIPALDQVNKL